MSVGFPGAGETCAPLPRKLFPGAGEKSHSFTIEETCVGFAGARGSCVPAPGKLFPGRGKVKLMHCREKVLVFPAPGEAVPSAGKFWSKVLERFRSKVPERM